MSTSPNRAVVLVGVLLVIAVALGLFLYSNRADAPAITEDSGVVATSTPSASSTPENTTSSSDTSTPSTDGSTSPAPVAPKPASKPVTSQPKPSVPTFGAVVSYTNGGFEPIRNTIFVGQTVRFVNNSDREMWVASDLHPTHRNYGEHLATDCLGSSFDQCKAVGKGEHWDFKFNIAGSWEFHNHKRAVDTGTIYVKERE